MLLDNLFKELQSNEDIGYFLANIIKNNSSLTVFYCINRVLEKYPKKEWFYSMFYRYSYNYLKRDNIHLFVNICEKYTLPENVFQIRLVNRCIHMNIDISIIKKIVDIGFLVGKKEIISACNCYDNDLIKYLANKL